MRLIAWNILHGGGTRVARIVEEVSACDPDVIAFTEFRARPGAALREAFADRGLVHVETTGPVANQNGIAVFSRTPLRRTPTCPAPAGQHNRWLDLHLPDYGFGVAVLHILAAAQGKKDPPKVRFWEATLAAAEDRLAEPSLLLGDWNTGLQRLDETGKTFVCAEHFARLSELGWTDVWRRHNPGNTEWTWYSKFKGGARANGFRLDHAFATPALLPRVRACRYSHRERDAGVSDHSMVIVEVDCAR